MNRIGLIVGCSLAVILPLVADEPPKAETKTEKGLIFATAGKTELKLDLTMPKEGDGPFPAVVVIHGGGWSAGDRGQGAFIAELQAQAGYVAATIDYRLAPAHRFPAQIEDCKASVRWLRANAKKYKIDPERIGAIGFSAGGHLACLLGTTTKDDGFDGDGGSAEQSSAVRAVVSVAGPTDLTTDGWFAEKWKAQYFPICVMFQVVVPGRFASIVGGSR
ncbi:MAG: alpha/beta hydrolase [Planctomycetes bacterium]|nr:alpha/beta hydrolase [Planctomycetota bacterium]